MRILQCGDSNPHPTIYLTTWGLPWAIELPPLMVISMNVPIKGDGSMAQKVFRPFTDQFYSDTSSPALLFWWLLLRHLLFRSHFQENISNCINFLCFRLCRTTLCKNRGMPITTRVKSKPKRAFNDEYDNDIRPYFRVRSSVIVLSHFGALRWCVYHWVDDTKVLICARSYGNYSQYLLFLLFLYNLEKITSRMYERR